MSKTLLLADDSVTIQKVVGISFANEDVRIVTVDNGDDAVTRAKEIQPDIVLADVVMPGKSGYDVCAALKEDPGLSGIPVLLLTGTFETFDEDRAARVGADGHITKPFEAQALVELVNTRLAGGPATPERTEPAPTERATAPTAEVPGTAPTAKPSAAPEPFDFLEPEQTTEPRPRSESGQRVAAESAEDPFGFESEALDAPDLDAEPDGLDDLGDDATEARTTVLLEEPAPDEVEGLAPTAPPVEAPAPDADDQTRLMVPEAEPVSEAPDPLEAEAAAALEPEPAPLGDPLDDVFDPVLGDELEEPQADSAYDVSSSLIDEPSRTQVIEDVDADAAIVEVAGAEAVDGPLAVDGDVEGAGDIEGDEALLGGTADPIFEDELSEASGQDLSPAPGYDLPLAPVAEEPIPAEPESPFAAEPAPTGAPVPGGAAALSPALQEQVHETLEKMAWEAFGDLSERIVREAVDRIEQVAWDVMPRLAETLIREEIRKLKGED
ncbi:MAG: response regulator [Myxococcota bacterium]